MIGLIMGPQGSGKGTQADIIQRSYSLKHVSMGDLLRKEIQAKTNIGKQIHETIDKGDLVPVQITNELTKKILNNEKNVLLDGYPRSKEQAEFLIKNYKIDFVIILDLEQDETIKRLNKRRICTATYKTYTAENISQKDIAECEKLGGKIIHREDDKPLAIKERLKIYHQETEPLIQEYSKAGAKIIKIKGEQKVDEVALDIKKELDTIIIK